MANSKANCSEDETVVGSRDHIVTDSTSQQSKGGVGTLTIAKTRTDSVV